MRIERYHEKKNGDCFAPYDTFDQPHATSKQMKADDFAIDCRNDRLIQITNRKPTPETLNAEPRSKSVATFFHIFRPAAHAFRI